MPERWACAVRSAARRASNESVNTGESIPKGGNPPEGRASQGATRNTQGPKGTHTEHPIDMHGKKSPRSPSGSGTGTLLLRSCAASALVATPLECILWPYPVFEAVRYSEIQRDPADTAVYS